MTQPVTADHAAQHRPRRADQYRAMMLLVWPMAKYSPCFYRVADDARRILRQHERILWFLRLEQRVALDAHVHVSGEASLKRAQRRRRRWLRSEFGASRQEELYTNHGYQFLRAWERATVLAKEAPLLANELRQMNHDQFRHLEEAQAHVEKLCESARQLLIHQRAVKDFIVFPNGWKWVLCHYGKSEWEGRFMHHCGNAGSKDSFCRLLSLREPVKSDGIICWKPHLTFTYSMTSLVEMKGRGNTKPAPRYYPYIRELFLHPRVTCLSSTLGYMPERDLSWNDLPVEMRQDIRRHRHGFFHSLRESALKRHFNPPPPEPPEPPPKPKGAIVRWMDNPEWAWDLFGFVGAATCPFVLAGPAFLWGWVERWAHQLGVF